MSFGAGNRRTNTGKGGTSTTNPLPPYTPTHADPSVITAGLSGFDNSSSKPEFSTQFTSLIGGSGGLGRRPSLARRSLVGGA